MYIYLLNFFGLQSYGEFTASQPWELIVTTLTGLMLVLIWAGDLGNHVMNTGKAAQGNSGSMLPSTPDSCRSGYKEASSPLINNDEYNGDGTQMEKVLLIHLIQARTCKPNHR